MRINWNKVCKSLSTGSGTYNKTSINVVVVVVIGNITINNAEDTPLSTTEVLFLKDMEALTPLWLHARKEVNDSSPLLSTPLDLISPCRFPITPELFH